LVLEKVDIISFHGVTQTHTPTKEERCPPAYCTMRSASSATAT
jgi:hypothetical protein